MLRLALRLASLATLFAIARYHGFDNANADTAMDWLVDIATVGLIAYALFVLTDRIEEFIAARVLRGRHG